jgi:hypothetical protein
MATWTLDGNLYVSTQARGPAGAAAGDGGTARPAATGAAASGSQMVGALSAGVRRPDNRCQGLLELSNQIAAEFRRSELRKHWLARSVPITPSPERLRPERMMNPKAKDCVPDRSPRFKMKAKYAIHAQRQLENLPDSATKNKHNAHVLVFGDQIHATTSWLMQRE